MKKSSLSIGTANKRLTSIAKTFGIDSAIYKVAEDYIEERITDEKYIKRNDEGRIISIVNSKHINTDTWGRSTLFNEAIPAVEDVIKKSLDIYKQDIIDKYTDNQGPITEEEDKVLNKVGPRTVKKDHALYNRLVTAALDRAEEMLNFDDIKDELYVVRDNSKSMDNAFYDANNFNERAQDILNNRSKTHDWIHNARKLVNEYDELRQNLKREKINAEANT